MCGGSLPRVRTQPRLNAPSPPPDELYRQASYRLRERAPERGGLVFAQREVSFCVTLRRVDCLDPIAPDQRESADRQVVVFLHP
jgi:hypothetical protein